jgi:ABC-2 type transport system permease protein
MSVTQAVKQYKWPQLAAAGFFGRRQMRGGLLWGLVFSFFIYVTVVGYTKVYNTPQERAQLFSSLSSNPAMKTILGEPHHLSTIGGYIDWRILNILVVLGAVWGLLAATKLLRGEASAGRWELFLAGQTTQRRAMANGLLGLAAGFLLLFVLTAVGTALTVMAPAVGFSFRQSLLFSVTATAGAASFFAVGALTSQIMPVRGRAAGLAAGVLGASFVLHALAVIAPSVHWLLYTNPLGWCEAVRPFSDSQAWWLLPLGGWTVILLGLAVYISGRGDMSHSVLADKDSSEPRTGLLRSPLAIALRLTRASTLGWLIATAAIGLCYGSVAKAAGQAFGNIAAVQKLGDSLTHQAQQAGIQTFAGVIFMIASVLFMMYVATAMGNVRETESQGYLDNLLVRLVGRRQWLWGRVLLVAATAAAMMALFVGTFLLAAATQHVGLQVNKMLLAGINSLAPLVLLLGISVCTFGLRPRITTTVAYATVAGSFLLQMVGSVLNLNHWVLDISILRHITLAPAVDPNWTAVGVYLVLGLALAAVGVSAFNRRDIQAE